MKKVLVIGSVNIDHVYTIARMPSVGETLSADAATTFIGGKGANQAVAASKFGAKTSFLGAIGNDQYKNTVLKNFEDNNVEIPHLYIDEKQNTGTAIIFSVNGDNSIVIERGANACVDKQLIIDKSEYIKSFDIIVLQNEIVDSAISAICEMKTDNQILIYNPAPFRNIDQSLLDKVDFITPNETEYDEMIEAGLKVSSDKLILTQGARGVTYNQVNYPASKVEPIDTTGAGDCFNGVFAACLSLGYEIDSAISYAVKAATISTLSLGAQSGYKSIDEIKQIK